MESVAVPYAVAALLLCLAGAQKLTHPGDASGALAALGLPSSFRLVHAGALAEIALGVVALVSGVPAVAVVVAAVYVAFSVFVIAALRAGTPIASCGCFGREDTPPSWLHVAFDGSIAVAALLAAFIGETDLGRVLGDQPWAGVPLIGFIALLTALSVMTLTLLPRTLALVNPAR